MHVATMKMKNLEISLTIQTPQRPKMAFNNLQNHSYANPSIAATETKQFEAKAA